MKEFAHRRFSNPEVITAKEKKVDLTSDDGSDRIGDKIGTDSHTQMNIGKEPDPIAVELFG